MAATALHWHVGARNAARQQLTALLPNACSLLLLKESHVDTIIPLLWNVRTRTHMPISGRQGSGHAFALGRKTGGLMLRNQATANGRE